MSRTQAKQLVFSKCHVFASDSIIHIIYSSICGPTKRLLHNEAALSVPVLYRSFLNCTDISLQAKNQQSQMCLFPQTKYSHRESEKCISIISSSSSFFLAWQFFYALSPKERGITRARQKAQWWQHFPKRLWNYWQKRKSCKIVHTLSICERKKTTSLLMEKSNKFKDSVKDLLTFTQDLLVEALMWN